MDKRQGLIVLSCVASVAIIGLIAIGAFKIFGSSDCELIESSSLEMINQGNKTFHSTSTIISSDSTLLIKISAHLEYQNIHDSHNNNHNSNNSNNTVGGNGPRAQALVAQPAISSVNALQQPAPSAAGSSVSVAANGGIGATSGAGFGAGVTAQQQQHTPTATNQPIAAAITVVPRDNNHSLNDNRRSQGKRFLALELDRVKSQGNMDSMGRQNYTLHFNCTKMTLTFARKADLVQIEQVTLDTKRVKLDGDSKLQKQATDCHLIVASQHGEHQKWSAEYNPKNGVAVYSCQKPELMRYRCLHNSEHLLDVQFEAIHFMISKDASQVSSKFDTSPTHQCS